MEQPCTLVLSTFEDNSNLPKMTEIKKNLENGDDAQKIEALKQAISLMMAGEKLPQLLMTIIRYVLTTRNHTLKKLLLLYWEVVDMIGPDGELLPEMILVCNALRGDLNHPNEYVRGATLRFLCKIKVAEILEPLVPSITKNLEHRHSYVRRNAVLAVQSVFLKVPQLCPDAPDLVYDFLKNEEDVSCKRNALHMLFTTSQEKAIRYLNENLAQVPGWGEVLQCAAIDMIRRHNRDGVSDGQKSRYVRAVLELLKGQQPTVQYEAACAILELSSSPISAKAAASAFIEILCNQSDNNIKFVILDKLDWIKKKQGKVLQELIMDILRALSCPSLEIRRKTLDLTMDLVTPRNIDSVIALLQKEIHKTQTEDVDKGAEYRKILIKAIHNCALKFPDIAGKVVHALMEHLGDNDVASAVNVISFVSEVVETYPQQREEIVHKLSQTLADIHSSAVIRLTLWVIGEYAESMEDLDLVFTQIKKQLGRMPFFSAPTEEEEEEQQAAAPEAQKPASKANKVLADGTYATQSAYVDDSASGNKQSAKKAAGPFLRGEILAGKFDVGAVAMKTLGKVALKLQASNADERIKNGVTAEVLYICACFLQYIEHSELYKDSVSSSTSHEEVVQLIRIILEPNKQLFSTLVRESREAHKRHLEEYRRTMNVQPEKKVVDVQVDDKLSIRLLQGSKYGHVSFEDNVEVDLMKATGTSQRDTEAGALSRVHQLTGFSDPLYAECYINAHRYDIVLEVLVINRTKDTLQNVGLELSTVGDLQITKRAQLQTHTLAPLGKVWIRADVKVSSTETGMIYGNLVYDVAGSAVSDKHCVVLNNIRVDILDYIEPATCSDSQYRNMWYEFEWENKVPVSAKAASVFEFLEDIIRATNMKCLTPQSAMEGDCRFLAANLYARSIFGEDALANMSIEQLENGEISGYIRIRSKTQGIALSLGDKIAKRAQP